MKSWSQFWSWWLRIPFRFILIKCKNHCSSRIARLIEFFQNIVSIAVCAYWVSIARCYLPYMQKCCVDFWYLIRCKNFLLIFTIYPLLYIKYDVLKCLRNSYCTVDNRIVIMTLLKMDFFCLFCLVWYHKLQLMSRLFYWRIESIVTEDI
jgi:hypothetical protein